MKTSLIRSAVLSACLLFCAGTPATAQVFPVNGLIVNGPDSNRVNIVFLGDGYTAAQISQFNANALNASIGLFNRTPYKEYASYFNVFAIEVPSNETGTDHPGTASDEPGGLPVFSADTYFNSTFDFASIHRLLVPQGPRAGQVLQANYPTWDAAFMVVNHTMYGGSGGAYATFSLAGSSTEIAIHELGHSFANLADEYDCCGSGYEAPNATAETVRELIRWNLWIEPDTPIPTPETSAFNNVVGLFEGAVYNTTGWYRPWNRCEMKVLGVEFCPVCREQTLLTIYNIIDILEGASPPDTGHLMYDDTVFQVSADYLKPSPNTMSVVWSVNGIPVSTNQDSFTFDASSVDLGNHIIEVVITDTTLLVRRESFGLMTTSTSWNVTTEAAPPYLGDVNVDGIVSSADIIYIVNHVFKSGPAPQPVPETGDLTCDGDVTSADIIRLVGYVFKSGPELICP